MKHSFIGSQLDAKKCATCSRDILSHSDYAKCESCGKVAPCEIADDMLLCADCERKHLAAVTTELRIVDNAERQARKELDKEIYAITNRGDFFNDRIIKHTQTIVGIKKTIDDDANVPDKNLEFQKQLTERYEHLCEAIFSVDDEKQDLVSEKFAIIESLRALGAELRAEYQTRLKELDAAYTPIKKPVTVKMPKNTLSPFERIVQSFAQASGMTLEQARQELIKKGIK